MRKRIDKGFKYVLLGLGMAGFSLYISSKLVGCLETYVREHSSLRPVYSIDDVETTDRRVERIERD